MVRDILLLGDPALYEVSAPVGKGELEALSPVIADLQDTLLDFRARHGCGRAIAAPQIGIKKRLIFLQIERPAAIINPTLELGGGWMELLDDCMSFPGLLVKVLRHKRCRISYRDADWKPCQMELEGSLSELLQHEYDHLDGILATMRAIDNRSYVMRNTAADLQEA